MNDTKTSYRRRSSATTTACRRFKNAKRAAGQAHCEACSWKPPHPSMWTILHVNHIVPVCCGGGDQNANLILLCPNHHAIVSNFFGKHTDLHTERRRYFGPPDRVTLIAWLREFDRDPVAVLSEATRKISESLEENI